MRFSVFISLTAAAMELSSCSQPHAPEETDDCLWDLSVRHSVSVTLMVDKDLSFFSDIRLDDDAQVMSGGSRGGNAPVLRYMVKAFRHGSTQEIASASGPTPTLEMSLPVGKIDIVGWVDYVDARNMNDLYFFTDDFNEMLVRSKYPYYANDPYKICYWGKKSMVLAYNTHALTVNVAPAMGQLRLIATDSPRGDVSDIKISYPGRVPSAIDAFSGEIAYSWADVFFNTTPVLQDNGRTLLAFDNIFSGEEQVSVPVRIDMSTPDGKTVARRLRIDAPVKRGGITEIRGEFYSIMEKLPPDPTGSGGLVIDTQLSDTIMIYF